jgi:hypothetical protein
MRIAQESDTLNGRAIVSIALLTLAVAAIGVLVAWQLVVTTRRPIEAMPGFQARRAGPPPAELNGVEMTPFPNAGIGRLGSSDAPMGDRPPPLTERYGWTDQSRGLVYIPVERAKELYLSGRVRSARAAPQPPERGGGP